MSPAIQKQPLHLNVSALPFQPLARLGKLEWGSGVSPPPFPSEAPPQTEGSDQGTFDPFCPTLALNSLIKPHLASASGPRLAPSSTHPQPVRDQEPRRAAWAPSPHPELLQRLGAEHHLGPPRDLTVLGSEGRELPRCVGPEPGPLRSAQTRVPLPSSRGALTVGQSGLHRLPRQLLAPSPEALLAMIKPNPL